MTILTIRTDQPTAEIGLFDDDKKLSYKNWAAHRQLAETIHVQIEKLLKSQNMTWQDIKGIACYKGPGSFTGLRIGLSVGNALAYGLNVPIVSSGGKDWIKKGITMIENDQNQTIVLPEYGAAVNITAPKK